MKAKLLKRFRKGRDIRYYHPTKKWIVCYHAEKRVEMYNSLYELIYCYLFDNSDFHLIRKWQQRLGTRSAKKQYIKCLELLKTAPGTDTGEKC
jgi:hypothetical protein